MGSYKTVTFNGVTLGDSVTKGPTTTKISRNVIIDPVSDLTGVVTRNRGGGQQDLEVECVVDFDNEAAKLVYLQTLWSAVGLTKGSLITTTPTLTWTNCLLLDLQPTKETGRVIWFKAGFVRSI